MRYMYCRDFQVMFSLNKSKKRLILCVKIGLFNVYLCFYYTMYMKNLLNWLSDKMKKNKKMSHSGMGRHRDRMGHVV